MRYNYIVLLTGLLIISACGSHSENKPSVRTRILYSPNGEPLSGATLGNPSCKEGLSGWFAHLDVSHQNAISHDAFLADAAIQFHTMDIDNNGYLISEELERYRLAFRPKVEPLKPATSAQDRKQNHNKSKEDSENESGDGGDPVMSADTNLDFKVTQVEFMSHAQKIFSGLDTNHDNKLSLDEVLFRCKTEK